MRELLTPKQVARAIGASEASLKRWCDKGIVPSVRTAGGHRRLPLGGVMEFLRRGGHRLVRPEVLGLPPGTGRGDTTLQRARSTMRAALEAGDEESFGRLTFDLHLSGHSAPEIFDKAIAPAFREIGARWDHGDVEVFEERRACETCMRVLRRFRTLLPDIPAGAPRAIGGTLTGDPYTIPTTMVEVALREAGWQADSYGTNLPPATVVAALERVEPRLLWLSISAIQGLAEFIDAYGAISEKASLLGIPLVVGGAALGDDVRRQIQYSAFCDTLGHLVSFARTVRPPEPERAPGKS